MPVILNAKEMSNLGLIYKINKEVLHPLGLALAREGDTIVGCVVADDGVFEYSKELIDKNEPKLDSIKESLNALLLLKGINNNITLNKIREEENN